MEVLIALAITGTMTTAGTLMMSQSLNGSRAVEERLVDMRQFAIADRLMRDDLLHAQVRPSVDPNSLAEPASFLGGDGVGDGNLISFVRDGWSNTNYDEPRGDIQKVIYVFRDGTLIRRAWLRPDPTPDTPFVDRVLYSGINRIDISYFREGREYNVWGMDKSGILPTHIEMEIKFSDADTLPLVFVVGGAS